MQIPKNLKLLPILLIINFIPIKAFSFSGFEEINLLFFDLSDAAQCLSLTVDDCEDLLNKSSEWDVSRWIGDLFCERASISNCNDCYTQIDGYRVIGVLPIVHEILLEPVVLHSYLTNLPSINNHGLTWFWGPALASEQPYRQSEDIELESLPWYNKNVSYNDIAYLTGGSNERVFSFGSPNDPILLSKDRNNFNYMVSEFNGNPLVVTQSLASYNYNNAEHPHLNIPQPAIVMPDNFHNLWSTPYDITDPNILTGSLLQRSDPIGETVKTQIYSPAKEYISNSSLFLSLADSNLRLCGANVEVFTKGSVHPEFAKAYATELYRFEQNNTDYTINDGLVFHNPSEAFQSNFHTSSGLWRGAATYVPLNVNYFDLEDEEYSSLIKADELGR